MKCKHAQQRLLTNAEPARALGSLAAHLSDCLSCQELQRHLLFLESSSKMLPIPPSQNRDRFVQRFLTGPVCVDEEPPTIRFERRVVDKERGMRKIALAFALSAALVLIAACVWAWQHENPGLKNLVKRPPTDPLVASLLERDTRLAGARTPRERIESLADLAEDLHKGTRTLARDASPADLNALAERYREVVLKGIVAQAKSLPMSERTLVLEPIASRLTRTSSEADALASEVTPESAHALRMIAAAARDGDLTLRELLRTARS